MKLQSEREYAIYYGALVLGAANAFLEVAVEEDDTPDIEKLKDQLIKLFSNQPEPGKTIVLSFIDTICKGMQDGMNKEVDRALIESSNNTLREIYPKYTNAQYREKLIEYHPNHIDLIDELYPLEAATPKKEESTIKWKVRLSEGDILDPWES